MVGIGGRKGGKNSGGKNVRNRNRNNGRTVVDRLGGLQGVPICSNITTAVCC